MRAGEWEKNFHPTNFRKQDYFFFGLSIWTNQVLINTLLVSVSQKSFCDFNENSGQYQNYKQFTEKAFNINEWNRRK